MKKFITPLLIVITVILAAVAMYILKSRDLTPPEIRFEKEIIFTEGQPESELLDGVTAYDEVDGDVSDTLVVERTLISDDRKTITVHYAAKDRYNNLKKADRVVDYVADPTKKEPVAPQKDKKYSIYIVNNLGIPNLGTNWGILLEKEGHTIQNVGLTDDIVQEKTIIYVKNKDDGTELKTHFPNALFEVGSLETKVTAEPKQADIYILLGTDATMVA